VHWEPPQTSSATARTAKAAFLVRRWVSKVRRPCLRIANDGRSRRTAHGLKRAQVNSLRNASWSSLEPPYGATRRKSVGSRTTAAKPASGGGPALEISRESAASSGHSSMEGALARRDAVSLTGHRGRPSQGVSFAPRCEAGSREGRQRNTSSPVARKKTPHDEGRSPRGPRSGHPSGSGRARDTSRPPAKAGGSRSSVKPGVSKARRAPSSARRPESPVGACPERRGGSRKRGITSGSVRFEQVHD
jgi:hypothetical protein